MRNLKIHLIQAHLAWQDSDANLKHFEALISPIEKDGIVVLPEMFATGFTMQPEVYAQSMDGEAVQWMKKHSKNRVVCGSLSTHEKGKFYNRFIWVENGEIKYTYDKRHLFSHGSENEHYSPGNKQICIEYQGWKIQPFVCYDLRFPVWCRNTDEAHLMLFVANWPTVRISVWEKLLQARAIENQCFVAGVNRLGADGSGIEHNGNSMFVDAKGTVLGKQIDIEMVITKELNFESLLEFRNEFPVLFDRDNFNIL